MKLSKWDDLRRKKNVMDHHFSSLFPVNIARNCYGYYDSITKTSLTWPTIHLSLKDIKHIAQNGL